MLHRSGDIDETAEWGDARLTKAADPKLRHEKVGAPASSAEDSPATRLLHRVLGLLPQGEKRRSVVILSGGVGSGKTGAAEVLAQGLRARGVSVGGVVAPRILGDGETIGYRIRDLGTKEERPFAKDRPPGIQVGRFFVDEQGLRFALAAIERGARDAQVVSVDEVGRWELSGGGLAPALRGLLRSEALPILLARSELASAVVEAFALSGVEFVEVEVLHAA